MNQDIFEAEVKEINEEVSNMETKKKGLFNKLRIGSLVGYLVVGTMSGFTGAYLATNYLSEQLATTPIQDSVNGNTQAITQVIYTDSNGNYSIADVAAMVKDSVVEIQTEVVTTSSYFGQYVSSGAGSGVIISNDGYIITNNHVIDGATTITVILTDGSKYDAKLIGTDSKTDLAIVKVEGNNFKPVTLGDSDELVVGQEVIAIGNPLGELGGSVSEGIISAKDREILIDNTTMTLLQTTAAVNPGNSGGGLFNLKGELIGVVNAKSSGNSVEGLGFAIPVATAEKVVSDLIEHGYVTGRPQLGIAAVEIGDYRTAIRYGVNQLGVYVQQTLIDNGLQAGDLIVQIDDTMITGWSSLSALIDSHEIGDELDVIIYRNQKQQTVTVTLTEYKPQ